VNAAVIKGVKTLAIEEVAIPEPGDRELLIRVQLAGVCGSDSSLYQGKLAVPFPVIPGHEAIGTIEAAGSKTERFRVGQRVTVHPNYFCGECPMCRKGLTNICRSKIRLGVDIDGVFADYAVIPEKAARAVPDGLPDEVAVFAEPLAVAAHAVKLAGLREQEKIMIFGAGVIGQLTLQMALLHSRDITACDLARSRLELARRMGARDIVSGQPELDACESAFDVVFETSGAPPALEMAIKLAAPGGRIVLLGLPGQSHPVSTVKIVRKELNILGSMIYTDEIDACLKILAQGRVQTRPLVSGIIHLDQLAATLDNFNAPERMKTLIAITGRPSAT
jgi:2-desacetyl-2-hydroxyethyl bacteriochlorophyllide A dehydrogenase